MKHKQVQLTLKHLRLLRQSAANAQSLKIVDRLSDTYLAQTGDNGKTDKLSRYRRGVRAPSSGVQTGNH